MEEHLLSHTGSQLTHILSLAHTAGQGTNNRCVVVPHEQPAESYCGVCTLFVCNALYLQESGST